MSFDLKTLYELLPSLYRIRDSAVGQSLLTPQVRAAIAALQLQAVEAVDPDGEAADGLRLQIDELQRGPLKALVSILAGQIAVLDENLDQLYDDLFIETCAEWVVPYIGDLIGTKGLLPATDAPFSQRPVVANTIGYRRRKGTASVVEQLARDVTGWNASVVEYFKWLCTTQYMNHLRPDNRSYIDLRDRPMLTWLNTPFDRAPHTAEVRRIGSLRGKYNIPNLGVFLWRVNSYPLTMATPYQVDMRRYTFDALGMDRALYNLPVSEETITTLATPLNVPMPLLRPVLHRGLSTYYGTGKSLAIYAGGQPVAAENISICDLGDLRDASGQVTGWYNLPQDKVAIDPLRGRLAFPATQAPPADVLASYHYGWTADIGGGEYSRSATFATGPATVVRVPTDMPTIQSALDLLAVSGGVVEVEGNRYYFETPVVHIAAAATIELRAADECRPVLVLNGALEVYGGAEAAFHLNGFLIAGGYLHMPLLGPTGGSNALHSVTLQHCTLVPGATPAIGPIAAQPVLPRLVAEVPDILISVDRCILGRVLAVGGSTISITNSILDAGQETEVAFADLSGQGPGASLNTINSTINGKVYTMILNASDSIFRSRLSQYDTWPGPVLAERLQQGCARFSYFPPGSRIPRPYHCQPASSAVAVTVQPAFTSLRYGDPGYYQLSAICPVAISQGADDGAEMGAFHLLYQPQRIANLQSRLDEYLRFSMEAGIFCAS
ncbi:hypothetical protein [Puia dinghuensis]|uniref:Uncharacterized protein n=1 Tax=Puia dinghuensis TaxID=1792502 RepID=A0A8J2U9Z9_9BACT|nr:hypothetical protein [Puia dinghuensis]GGA88617.1 hypothetical protein GCM10011511_09800 [Puia dinghuensis]